MLVAGAIVVFGAGFPTARSFVGFKGTSRLLKSTSVAGLEACSKGDVDAISSWTLLVEGATGSLPDVAVSDTGIDVAIEG
jgi:hypothetical protein